LKTIKEKLKDLANQRQSLVNELKSQGGFDADRDGDGKVRPNVSHTSWAKPTDGEDRRDAAPLQVIFFSISLRFFFFSSSFLKANHSL
jgi:hypothetical protein